MITAQIGLEEFVTMFHQDRDAVIDSVYREFRKEYLSFAEKISSDRDRCVDSFQEAVIALFENAAQHKIIQYESSLKTYLFAIGRNKILQSLKKEKNQRMLKENMGNESTYSIEIDEELLDDLRTSFSKLGKKCAQILTKFYYHRFSIDAIRIEMKYKNENTVKAHKSRCMAQLRSIIKALKK